MEVVRYVDESLNDFADIAFIMHDVITSEKWSKFSMTSAYIALGLFVSEKFDPWNSNLLDHLARARWSGAFISS